MGTRARRRAAEYADGWITLQPGLDQLAADFDELRALATQFDRPFPAVTVMAPALLTDHSAAVDLLAAHRDAGVERVILAPTGPEWQRDYENAAKLRAAL